jgi:spermidine synthase
LVLTIIALCLTADLRGAVVFERTSPYHQVRVVDERDLRILSFNGTWETRMSLQNPLKGHFEYTEYFHMPLLWNTNATDVLMIGLGGGSAQRAYAAYQPEITIDTVELDPVVVEAARRFFNVKETPKHKIHLSDGRVFIRRTEKKYDIIILDAYTKGRYGSFIPYHLATGEFFKLANACLKENGVLAYNVIGTIAGYKSDILSAMFKTMKSVFPQVYLFPANDSMNIVLVATKSSELMTLAVLQQRASELARQNRVRLPALGARIGSFRSEPPPAAATSRILTDDFAPVDGLLNGAPQAAEKPIPVSPPKTQ